MLNKIASITQVLKAVPILYSSRYCVLCSQAYHGVDATCPACCELFVPLGPACQYCSLPISDVYSPICGTCCLKKPCVDRVISAYRFEEPLRTLLHLFKYQQGLYLTSLLTKLMLESSPNPNTQCLIPIPMHPKRLRERGFNQAAILAKSLSKHLQLPYEVNLCKKIKNTMPQAGLNSHTRKTNLNGAFEAALSAYSHVTLIDDLLTTGSTANELAHLLKKQGVKQVDVWCCARAY